MSTKSRLTRLSNSRKAWSTSAVLKRPNSMDASAWAEELPCAAPASAIVANWSTQQPPDAPHDPADCPLNDFKWRREQPPPERLIFAKGRPSPGQAESHYSQTEGLCRYTYKLEAKCKAGHGDKSSHSLPSAEASLER
jgi:hypothetical protein